MSQEEIDNEEYLQMNPANIEEEEEDEFPEYANEQNKQLNEIIKEKKRLIRDISRKIDEKADRTKILKEHLKNVKQELLTTQVLIDQKNKEIETEDHMRQIAERQIGRIQAEFRKLDKQQVDQQEKLNDIQNQIFKGNEKMDQFRLEINWHNEELEQWALAARQKEEDNLTLEKYKRQDELKIKELNLQIERLTQEVTKKQNELEQEITETQASQIELDKTAEEFKKQHEERQRLFQQWEEVTSTINQRDRTIRQEGENFARIKIEIKQMQDDLKQRKEYLRQTIGDNKRNDTDILTLDKTNITKIQRNKEIEEESRNKKAEVEIFKNQVSSFASELSNKEKTIANLQQELLTKKQRLNAAQKKYKDHEIKLYNEAKAAKTYKQNREEAEKDYKETEKEKADIDRKIRINKENLFKQTEELFKLREKEANLYGEIQGSMAACRNLQSHINKLNQEFSRQQELLYNAEYQIQLMERKVNRAKGEHTLEEKKDLDEAIKAAKEVNAQILEDHTDLKESLKKLDDEIRAINKLHTFTQSEKKKYEQLSYELQLENDMTYQDLNKIVKQKEEVLVQHDVMKLEIQKIHKKLQLRIDDVFELENNKDQIELSMQEREKEIQVHKDVIITKLKQTQEEKHKIAVELSQQYKKVKNLQIKYESLVQKNKNTSEQVDNVNEHLQANYVIRAAQEREELQIKGDELNAQIIKAEKELKGFANTLMHLRCRNAKEREKYLNKGLTKQDIADREQLDTQLKASSEACFKVKDELSRLQQEMTEETRQYNEKEQQIAQLYQQTEEIKDKMNKYNQILQEQEKKIERANKTVIQQKLQLDDENIHLKQQKFDNNNLLQKIIDSSLFTIAQDFPELQSIFKENFDNFNIEFPDQAPSAVSVVSQKSLSQQSGLSH